MTNSSHKRRDPTEVLPSEKELWDEAREIFSQPDKWMTERHPMLDGRSPQDCIQAGDQQLVRDLVRNIKYVGQV